MLESPHLEDARSCLTELGLEEAAAIQTA